MRLLHVTDTHLGIHRWFVGAPPEWRRADDFLTALQTALAPAFAGEVDLVVHTGDLFDRSQPPVRAIEEARTLLSALGAAVPVVVMPGNHDWRGLRASIGAGISGVHVLDTAARVQVAGLWLGVVPWLASAADWAAAAAHACAGVEGARPSARAVPQPLMLSGILRPAARRGAHIGRPAP